MLNLDSTDLRIIKALQDDGSLTVSQVADRAGISQSPCSRRIIQLQELGVIRGKSVDLDPKKLGFNLSVVARIKLKMHDVDSLDNFKLQLQKIPEVQTAVLMLGDFDFHLSLLVRDIDHYHDLLQDTLLQLPGVQELQSSVVLEVVKNTRSIPL